MAEAEMDLKEVPADPPPAIRQGKKTWTFCKVKKKEMREGQKSPRTPVAATRMKGNVDTETVQIVLEKDKRGQDEVMSLSGGSAEKTNLVEGMSKKEDGTGRSKESILEDGEIN
ncbi:hypothetical protein F2Q70_00013756 [Brassica cretica]|uniref:Uncharacterized protein n=1 Tax=Brassica cretica TaxID=69181 RepID=A0A8S9M281_BRACR|nr:hypothetical protein F2Q70_00013756 [Brassica cretica]